MNLFEQAKRWVRDGHQVTVVCSDPGREHASARDEVVDGVSVRRRGGRFTVYLHAAIFMLLNSRGFDRVLDVANGIPFFAPLFSRKPAVLLVHHVHDQQWFSEFPRPLATVGWFVERRIVPLLYRRRPVIAVSPTTCEALINLGVPEDRIRIVYNGVEKPEQVSGAGRSSGKGRPEGQGIAYVGRLKRYKRLDRLVRMVADLRHGFPDLRLDLAGDGDAKDDLESLVNELRLQDHVTIHGFVDKQKKAEILSAATVFATPSMHEGWGLSVVEANSCGCPAVAYNVPGLRAAIRHGETGLLADDNDSFRRSLSFFLENPAARQRYSIAARHWAARFSWETCASETLEVLRSGKVSRPLRAVDPAA